MSNILIYTLQHSSPFSLKLHTWYSHLHGSVTADSQVDFTSEGGPWLTPEVQCKPAMSLSYRNTIGKAMQETSNI